VSVLVLCEETAARCIASVGKSKMPRARKQFSEFPSRHVLSTFAVLKGLL
jgi:hypothetical protein